MPTFRIASSCFEQLHLERVEVITSARSGGGSEHHVFEPSAALEWQAEQPVESYRLRIVPAADGFTIESREVEPGSPTGPIDVDLRLFDARELPWSTIRTAEVDYTDVAGTPRSFFLTADRPIAAVFAGIDYEPGQPIVYSLDYVVPEGNYLEKHQASTRSIIPVRDPFGHKTVTFEGVGLAGSEPSVHVVQLGYSHLEQGPGWQLSGGNGSAQLQAAGPSKEISYRVVDPTSALTRYQGTVIYANGRQQPIPEAAIPQTRIQVGDAPIWWTVEVDPGQIDWTRAEVVVVQLAAGGPAGEPQNLAVFWRGVPSRFWSFQVPAGTSGTVAWRAWYVRATGLPAATPWADTSSHRLVLPAYPAAEAHAGAA